MRTERELYKYLIERLVEEGFILQIYESQTSDSYYMKLDYGVAHSIRISDHKSKSRYKQKYQIGSFIGGNYRTRKINDRFYYGTNEVDEMIADIIQAKKEKLNNYGDIYYRFMNEDYSAKKHNLGFWKESQIVQKDGISHIKTIGQLDEFSKEIEDTLDVIAKIAGKSKDKDLANRAKGYLKDFETIILKGLN